MFNYQHWGLAFLILLAFTLNLLLFLLPGFAAVILLATRRSVKPVYRVIVVTATTATLGYASFWIFFANRVAGKVFTFAIYGLTLFCIGRSFFKTRQMVLGFQQIATPFLLTLLAGICYVSLFYLFGDPHNDEAGLANARFFEEGQAGDNIIPLIFAGRIYAHEPVRPFCCGDWLSSDRPPLQAGIFLLERPLRIVSIGLHYQLLATALQCLWVCGVWCLLTVLEASGHRIRQVIVILICSGFFFYNSVYTWPKLLAAACILFLLSILLDVICSGRPATRFQMILAGVCLGLAMMAHPGSVFSLPALSVICLRYRRLFSVRETGLVLPVVLVFSLPWSAYQKFVDPPGNRLLKMHLAGEPSVDSRSTWQGITDAYRSHSWREILQFKLSNLATLFGGEPLEVLDPGFRRSAIVNSRVAQWEWVWNDIGVLNIGWLGAAWLLFHRRKHSTAVPCSLWFLAVSILNLVVWCAVMFGPNGTLARHSSYADIILLSIGLCGYLFTLPSVIALAVFVLELWNLVAVWAFFPPVAGFPQGAKVEMPFLFSGSIALGILIWIFAETCFRRDASEQGCTLP